MEPASTAANDDTTSSFDSPASSPPSKPSVRRGSTTPMLASITVKMIKHATAGLNSDVDCPETAERTAHIGDGGVDSPGVDANVDVVGGGTDGSLISDANDNVFGRAETPGTGDVNNGGQSPLSRLLFQPDQVPFGGGGGGDGGGVIPRGVQARRASIESDAAQPKVDLHRYVFLNKRDKYTMVGLQAPEISRQVFISSFTFGMALGSVLAIVIKLFLVIVRLIF